MSEVVGAVLAREDIAVGNKPVAVWKYNIPGEPLPKVRMLMLTACKCLCEYFEL